MKGRLTGYRGLYPFHVAVLPSRDLADPRGPLAWGTADTETGAFDIPIPSDVEEFYLLGQLDLERQGPRLHAGMLFFLKKLPIRSAEIRGKRLLFDLGDMELAHVMRDAGAGGAPWIALGLALLLYGVGVVWYRRLPDTPRVEPPPIPPGRWPLWLIAAATSLPLAVGLGAEPLELLEFTYLHEGLRPASVWTLLTDPISAELSHPPLWPLVLRALASVARAEWWLRLPAALCHLGTVLLVYRLVAPQAGRRAGLLAALVCGLLPVGFYYGRDATPYALLGLLSAAAMHLALRERWRSFAAVLTLGFFTHYTVAVLGLALGVALFWYWRHSGDKGSGRMRRALVGFALVCPLPLLWSVHFIATFLASGMSTRLMSVDYLPDPGFGEYVGHFGAVILGLPPELALALPLVLAFLLWAAVRALRTAPLLGRLVLIQLLMVVLYVLFVHLMYMRFAGGRVFYAYRWTTVFLPAVAVAFALGLDAWLSAHRRLGQLATGLLIAGCVWQAAAVLRTPQRPAQWAAAARIHAERLPGDAFCALPAVYYAQLFHYVLSDRAPADLMAWPTWNDGLYGPLHPRNTSIETLSKNLAFGRVWVVVYDEHMFGTRKFDPTTSEHPLDWLRTHLDPDGEWTYAHLRLYRFRVPPAPELLWKDGRAKLELRHTIRHFRYFPEHLHTQETGRVMSAREVAIRLPSPHPGSLSARVDLTIEMRLGRPAVATDLHLEAAPTSFTPTTDGGHWKATLEVTRPLIDLRLVRSPGAAEDHRNTILHLAARLDGRSRSDDPPPP